MNRLKALWKKLRVKQILTVLFAGILLLATQACADVGMAVNPKPEAPTSAVTSDNTESTPVETAPEVEVKAQTPTESVEENVVEPTINSVDTAVPVLDNKEEQTENVDKQTATETQQPTEDIKKVSVDAVSDTPQEVATETQKQAEQLN